MGFVDWLIPVAYLATAAIYARLRLRRIARTTELLDPDDPFDRGILGLIGLGIGLVWPVAIVWDLVVAWLLRPADADQARVERLEADLAAWRAKRHAGSEDERRMANDIVESLQEALAAERGSR